MLVNVYIYILFSCIDWRCFKVHIAVIIFLFCSSNYKWHLFVTLLDGVCFLNDIFTLFGCQIKTHSHKKITLCIVNEEFIEILTIHLLIKCPFPFSDGCALSCWSAVYLVKDNVPVCTHEQTVRLSVRLYKYGKAEQSPIV